MKGMIITLGTGTLMVLGSVVSARADSCKETAKIYAAGHPHATAIFWDGARTYLNGTEETAAADELIYYLSPGKETTTDGDLGVPGTMGPDADPEKRFQQLRGPVGCEKLFSRVYRRFAVDCEADPSARGCDGLPGALLQAYRGSAPSRTAFLKGGGERGALELPSAMSLAGEAAQILGQIVVDRASQAAYAQLTKKLLAWMHCGSEGSDRSGVVAPPAAAGGTPEARPGREQHGLPDEAAATTRVMTFPSTCGVIENLRVQDLAMSPAVLRQALAADVLAFLLPAPRDEQAPPGQRAPGQPAPNRDGVTVQRSTFAASSGPARSTPPEPFAFAFLRTGLERRLVPLLNRPLEVLTGRSAEIELRDIVDQGLAKIESNTTEAFCKLEDQNRVLATAALGFAACELRGVNACPVMQYVRELDAACPSHLGPARLTYAESIAGHLLDAYSLQRTDKQVDGKERLVAAADATFEIACMYAVPVDDGTGYECRVIEGRHGAPVARTETVALARDVVRAALDRDGAGLAAVIVRAAVRFLPDVADRTEPRAIRALATIAAYAATYTSAEPSKDAHQQRTALLESLTRDMTVRTDRGGDVIFGLGGALRGVGGVRIGRSSRGSRPTAIASPLSLTLGFGLDSLFERKAQGLHLEAGVFDLGQYLALDEGEKVTTPDLSVALSPSLTFAYFWHRDVPLYLGVTAGYTPRYDFAPDGDKPRGAFNVGLTFGAYVPLFDFN